MTRCRYRWLPAVIVTAAYEIASDIVSKDVS
jgi:hypothetical protein